MNTEGHSLTQVKTDDLLCPGHEKYQLRVNLGTFVRLLIDMLNGWRQTTYLNCLSMQNLVQLPQEELEIIVEVGRIKLKSQLKEYILFKKIHPMILEKPYRHGIKIFRRINI